MTTEPDSEDNMAVSIPQCKNVETMTGDDALLRAFQVPPVEPLQAGSQGVDIRIRVRSSQTANHPLSDIFEQRPTDRPS